MKRINFDMDGTIANLYAIENWLEYLINEDVYPYKMAEPMLNLNTLARKLNNLQRQGYELGIISWLSRNGSERYNKEVIKTKIKWLNKHLSSVRWDRIVIVPYGTPKENYCIDEYDILFDDDERVRINWTGQSFPPERIMEILKTL